MEFDVLAVASTLTQSATYFLPGYLSPLFSPSLIPVPIRTNGYGGHPCDRLHLIGQVKDGECEYLVNTAYTIHLGWFKGLSSSFLACRTARLLVLAGTDRLDKELMIGQMQGKFQMEVIPEVGHMLQEVRNYRFNRLHV